MLADTPDSPLRVPPWHQPITRRPGEAQFGLAPDAAIVTGLTDLELALVRRLDGTQSLLASCRDAHDAGVAPSRWRELVDLLAELGVVEPVLRVTTSTSGPAVIVEGSGALADHIATLLGETVRVAHRPVGTRHRFDEAAEKPALVVLVGSPALDPRDGDAWLTRGTAHLPITVAGPRTTVGPLVLGPCGPCLWCLDLHRADRDHAWPTVMAQLCSPGASGRRRDSRDSDPLAAAAAHLTAASVTVLAQSVLTGHRPPVGVSLDLWVPWPRIDYRRWEVHPHCTRHRGCPDCGAGDPADHCAAPAGTIAAVA